MTLRETGVRSGIFVSEVPLPTTFASAMVFPSNGTLEFNIGDNLQLVYTDGRDDGDSITALLQSEPIVWNNNSGDGLWDTAANWSLNRVPTKFDRIVFNATSVDSVTNNSFSALEFISLSLEDGYTGEVEFRFAQLELHEQLKLESGTLDANGNVIINRDFVRIGGVFESAATLSLLNSGQTYTTLGPTDGLSLRSLTVGPGVTLELSSEPLTLTNNLRVEGTIEFVGTLNVESLTYATTTNSTISGTLDLGAVSLQNSGVGGSLSLSGTTTTTSIFLNSGATTELRLSGQVTATSNVSNYGIIRLLPSALLTLEMQYFQSFNSSANLILETDAMIDAEGATFWTLGDGTLTESGGFVRRFATGLGFIDVDGDPVVEIHSRIG